MIDNSDNIFSDDPADAEDDIVEAYEGHDSVISGDGDDYVYGHEGNDTVRTGDGNDTVEGGDDNDEIITDAEEEALDAVTFPGVPVDEDPENDRDLVFGDDGNDTISTGDDRDTIHGGEGDDVITPGIDDDLVYGGGGNDSITDLQGADTIEGGDGDDTILAGIDTFSDYVGDDPNLPIGDILADPNTDDGRDWVSGGAGNDSIMTGDDSDTVYGGEGNDTLDSGIDDDWVEGGEGDDSILGGHGSDTIYGDGGDDYIDAGAESSGLLYSNEPDATDPVPENDTDYVEGGDGNDTILGGDDDDTLLGGAGDDVIDGGIDEDLLEGGEGADTVLGGDGRDTIIGSNVGDSVDGGDGPGGDAEDGMPNDYDTLDLTNSAPPGGSISVTYTSPDNEDGFVEYFDDTGALLGTSTFEDIENVIVPCFTPGTTIATPMGERLIEDLREGDRVITRDNGLQEVRWIGQSDLTGHQLARAPHLRPILIQAGSLGDNLPEQDILVSPQHRILLTSEKAQLYFEEREVLVAAKHLTHLDGVDEVGTLGVTYIHFMFDQHEVVLSNGAWTESFQPGDVTMQGMGDRQKSEIYELFPELETAEGLQDYSAARRSLKKHEAKLLVR
ncbi:MAG: type I secretion protein [Rhodobacteraceae bacterium]|nr:MAG: type I secretion protein [Paracoccaceae bacterium]